MKKLLFLGLFIFSASFSYGQTEAERATVKAAVSEWATRYSLNAAQIEKASNIQFQKLANIAEVETAVKQNGMTEDMRLKKMVALNEGAISSLTLSFDKAQKAIYSDQRSRLRVALNKESIALKNAATSSVDFERGLLKLKSEFAW
jgi:hypothetical protein